MTAFFFKGIPEFRMNGFSAVRDSFDNLSNLLHVAELANTCSYCLLDAYEKDFDFAVFSGNFSRALIRNNDSYFSMAIPFQLINNEHGVTFNFDIIGEEVNGFFISIMKNALQTSQNGYFGHDDIVYSISENFGLEIDETIYYYDAFIKLLSEDHGYFRFDDDIDNENGHIHPRYHFDFFYKNSTSVKIGMDEHVDIDCFYSLFDKSQPKRYLATRE